MHRIPTISFQLKKSILKHILATARMVAISPFLGGYRDEGRESEGRSVFVKHIGRHKLKTESSQFFGTRLEGSGDADGTVKGAESEADKEKTQLGPTPPSARIKKSRVTFQRKARLVAGELAAVAAATTGNSAKAGGQKSCFTDGQSSKLKLKLTRLVKKSRSDSQFEVFTKSVRSTVDSLRDAIDMTRRSAAEALSKLNKGDSDAVDSAVCDAASTQAEQGQMKMQTMIDCKFLGLKMTRWASRFGANRRAPVVVTASCLVGAPSSSRCGWTPMRTSRHRKQRIKKYLDDGDEEEEEAEEEATSALPQERFLLEIGRRIVADEENEEEEEEARTPQERFLPGIGRRIVITNLQGKALRLEGICPTMRPDAETTSPTKASESHGHSSSQPWDAVPELC